MPPIAAALVVTVMPAAALAAGPFERRVADPRVRAAAGTLLGVGRRRRSRPAARRGLGLDARAPAARRRRPRALAGRAHRGRRWPGARRRRSTAATRSPRATRASCSGSLLLTPVFVADLDQQRDRATAEGRRARAGRAHRRTHEGRPRLAASRATSAASPGACPTSTGRSPASTRAIASGRRCSSSSGSSTTSSTAPRRRRSSARSCSPPCSRRLALIPDRADEAGDAVMPPRRTLAVLGCSAALARLGAGRLPRARRWLVRALVRAQSVRRRAAGAIPGGVRGRRPADRALGPRRRRLPLRRLARDAHDRPGHVELARPLRARAPRGRATSSSNAVRRGLERALDDAERAGAIGGFRATALRFADRERPRRAARQPRRDGGVAAGV